MYKEGKAQRDASGKITQAAAYQSREIPKARVEPNRKWFGNTRVISQDALTSFRNAMAEKAKDPYSVLLKTNKLPMTMIRDGSNKNGLKEHQAKIAVEAASFADTFGPKAQRKRVKMNVATLEDLAEESGKLHEGYQDRIEQMRAQQGLPDDDHQNEQESEESALTIAREPIFSKGQSKRIWNELYKVIDSSDVVIQVLDARQPEQTRCKAVETFIREEAPHKHLVFVLNKVDLIPTRVAVSRPFFHFPSPCKISHAIVKSRHLLALLATLWGVCLLRLWQSNLVSLALIISKSLLPSWYIAPEAENVSLE